MSISTARARRLRKLSPRAERIVWQRLRNRKLGGEKFVRQLPIGPFFADFACRDRLLIVEIDGATHSTALEVAHDLQRTDFLQRAGFTVLRFSNESIYQNLDGVMETILARLEGRQTL